MGRAVATVGRSKPPRACLDADDFGDLRHLLFQIPLDTHLERHLGPGAADTGAVQADLNHPALFVSCAALDFRCRSLVCRPITRCIYTLSVGCAFMECSRPAAARAAAPSGL